MSEWTTGVRLGRFTAEDANGDSVEVYDSGAELCLRIASDWYGDTETGFGAELSITMPIAIAEAFIKASVEALARARARKEAT